jgi:hypothetical protein
VNDYLLAASVAQASGRSVLAGYLMIVFTAAGRLLRRRLTQRYPERAAALPVPVEILEQCTVGPTLGKARRCHRCHVLVSRRP